jgi:hypothetical protein
VTVSPDGNSNGGMTVPGSRFALGFNFIVAPSGPIQMGSLLGFRQMEQISKMLDI